MATSYSVLDSFKTIQVLSAQTVADIQYVTVQTSPSRINFAYAMPHEVWVAGPPYEVFQLISEELENLVVNYHVVAGDAVQDLDANGLLVDYVSLVVQYDQAAAGLPPLQGTVSIPVGLISLEATDPTILNASGQTPPPALVQAEYDRLAALAAG